MENKRFLLKGACNYFQWAVLENRKLWMDHGTLEMQEQSLNALEHPALAYRIVIIFLNQSTLLPPSPLSPLSFMHVQNK